MPGLRARTDPHRPGCCSACGAAHPTAGNAAARFLSDAVRDRRLAGGAVHTSMPLMDKILIPYQNGTPIDHDLVMLYLGGLLASALVAWGLGWARTYILALVSERMGADLRTTTYQHLLALSQNTSAANAPAT